MRKFHCLLFVLKRSFICYYVICMPVPLTFFPSKVSEYKTCNFSQCDKNQKIVLFLYSKLNRRTVFETFQVQRKERSTCVLIWKNVYFTINWNNGFAAFHFCIISCLALKRKWKKKEMREQLSRGALKNQCSETSGTFLEIMLKVSVPDLPPTTTYK